MVVTLHDESLKPYDSPASFNTIMPTVWMERVRQNNTVPCPEQQNQDSGQLLWVYSLT
jgi:hypothetical protein